jgi:lauroyl/myristoyl acyltransferase
VPDPRTARRPFIGLADVRFIVELPWLWLVAWFVPERHWQTICIRAERIKAQLGWFDPRPVAGAMARALGADDCVALAVDSAAGRSECHLQVLRAHRPGAWSADLELAGLEHLTAALSEKRGCVLWVAHFCFNSLAVKMALARAGKPIWHVSRPEHGFSKTRFGIAVLNPIRVAAERRNLAGRILIDRSNPGGALLAAQSVLETGGIVSFTAGAWEGVRPIDVEFMGGRLPLSIGAPGLAVLTGAALLPVFTTRGASRAIRVEIGAPLAQPVTGSRNERILKMAQDFTGLTELQVRRYPAEWRDWKNLRLRLNPVA